MKAQMNKKALEKGLWWIWLSGLLLIAISFYVTTQIPTSSVKDQIMLKSIYDKSDSGYSVEPTITIFTAPAIFNGSVGERHVLAVKSWLGLSPKVNVVLFAQNPEVVSFAARFGPRVSVESDIDFTFLGTPFFHSMVARAEASKSDISVIIDPETILMPNFIKTLNYAHKLDHDWLLFSFSRSVAKFQFHLDDDGKFWLREDNKTISTRKLQDYLGKASKWTKCGERILLAWNKGDIPLHNGVLPPFLFQKGFHNNWVINEALLSKLRFIFDASLAISSFNIDISYSENKSWERIGNFHLASSYGSLFIHDFMYSNVAKLFECGGRYNFDDPKESLSYPLRNKGVLPLRKSMVDCLDNIRKLTGPGDCNVKDQLKLTTLNLPFSLERLLPMVADENKNIVLTVAGYSYKDMLMSWVCRLRQLMISNFVVCALDQETYEFSMLQGIQVFKDPFAPTNVSFNDCHFGTMCFQRVTKVKSRVVLQILKLGYNVLLSDVDVYWFKNPQPYLFSFGPGILVVQSDEYNLTGPVNMPRRLNSGFYFALTDNSTISALEKVVRHAAKSNLSEQPSFYDTLCGEGGSNRVGDDRCFESKTNLTIHFLDRNLFPNGAYHGLWEVQNVKKGCEEKGCLILHNNWISGRRKKLERQILSGLWEYDSSSRTCMHHWNTELSERYF